DRGLDFDQVTVAGELGAMPAWFVPPTTATASTTWIIAVHGRRGTMTEPLRILPTLAASGHPTLVISYRNDPTRRPAPTATTTWVTPNGATLMRPSPTHGHTARQQSCCTAGRWAAR